MYLNIPRYRSLEDSDSKGLTKGPKPGFYPGIVLTYPNEVWNRSFNIRYKLQSLSQREPRKHGLPRKIYAVLVCFFPHVGKATSFNRKINLCEDILPLCSKI